MTFFGTKTIMPCQDICQTFQTYHFIRHYWLLSWSHFQPIFPLATIWLCMGTSRLICLSNTYCKQLHLFFNPSISSWLITHPFKNRKCTSSKSRITTILFFREKKKLMFRSPPLTTSDDPSQYWIRFDASFLDHFSCNLGRS